MSEELAVEILRKINDMEKKLEQCLEGVREAVDTAKLCDTAFPDGNRESHRRYHEEIMQITNDRAELRKSLIRSVASWGIIGLLSWLAYVVWKAFLLGPAK